MKVKEMWEQAKQAYQELKEDWAHVGIRFEAKERYVGEICEDSKHNPDREDEREFPEYGTEEYNNLPELEGTSAWNLEAAEYLEKEWHFDFQLEEDAKKVFGDHAYIVVGNITKNHDDCDNDEIVIPDAEVAKIIF